MSGKISVSKEWTSEEREAVAQAIRADLAVRAEREPVWVKNGRHPTNIRSREYHAKKKELEFTVELLSCARAEFLENNRDNFLDWIE